jgi:ABC-type transport system substrate-binding protein
VGRAVSVLVVLAGLALACALAGCGSDPYPGEEPSTLHVFLVDAIKGLDPAQADDEISSICVLSLYDQLYEYHYLKRPFELKPCLAEAMPELSEDRLTCTIRLREGIRYADDPCFPGGRGREVVASDVVFSLLRLMDARTNSPGSWILEGRLEGLDAFVKASETVPEDPHRDAYRASEGYPEVPGLSAPDDRTLVLRLTEPYAELTWVLAMGYASVLPPEAVRRYGRQLQRHAVGSAAYTLETFLPAQKIVLRRNPSFREERYPAEGAPGDAEAGRLADAGRRLPLNERVVATVFRESSPQWLYFRRGYLDRTTIPKDTFDVAVDAVSGALRPEFVEQGVRLDKDPKIEVIYDCFNMEDPVVGTPAGEKGRALRRAMSLASDDEWAIRHLYNGRAVRVDGPILEEFPEHDPEFRNPWKPGPGESRAQTLARARKILADAGFPGGKGVPVIEQDVLDNDTSRQFFQAFQRDMKEVGIPVRAYQVTWPEHLTRTREKKAQMWGIAWGADYPAAQNFLQLFYGPNASPGPNGSNYANPEFDRLYEEAARLGEGPERTALYRRMQEIVVDDCVWGFRYRRVNFNLLRPWLHGYRYNDLSQKYFAYCRVEPALREQWVRRLNQQTWWPVWTFGGALLGLVALTLAVARRTKRGW